MNKEEIEKAKEELQFFNEGDYITKEMENSARVLEEYIKELENEKTILDKVTDKLKQFKTDLKAHEKKYEYKKDISTGLIGVRINAILNIIEGEKE